MKQNYEVLFPYNLVEVLNGILGPALFWMSFFLAVHLVRSWKSIRHKYGGPGGFWRSARAAYRDFKPEIALFVIISAFCIRTLVLWYVRWLKNNDIDWDDWVTDHSGEMLIWFTFIIILGVSCWIRVISPLSGRTAVGVWAMMVLSSLAFGLGMHFFF
jgi:hypothetical protein